MKVGKILLINVAVLLLLLAVLEGGASLLFTANQVRRTPGTSEQSYSKYDETLGWVSRPNVSLPDLYGPGVYLHTNAQAFRGKHDVARAVPPGKIRVVCSGDSFTLGFGVNDDQAWCQRLATFDARLETANMGQGGYGLDQAYLWYTRAGAGLEHQVHLFAFITDDFFRMKTDRFLGYGKPVLALRNDSIVVRNKPVPETWGFTRWRAVQGHAIGNLNIVRLGQRLFGMDEAPVSGDSFAAGELAVREIVSRIFEDLARVNRQKNSRLMLVYLPGPGDYRANDATSSWRSFVQREAARLGVAYVDLVEAIRKVPPTEINDLFAPNSHYSVIGNEFIAMTLAKTLIPMLSLPAGR